MPSHPPSPTAPQPHRRAALPLCAALTALALAWPAQAERADRSKPMTLESDKPCVANWQTQTSVCSGNVVVTQGTLLLRAERLELREVAGFMTAQAFGGDAQPARFRQKRDGADEAIEGQAQRIVYDGRAGTVRFEGQALVRRLRGGVAGDELQGALIVWNSVAEQLDVQGGGGGAGNPGGRVRVVITPRGAAEDAAAPPAPAASGLRTSPALGERR